MLSRILSGASFTVWRYTHTPSYLRLVLSDIAGALFAIGVAYLSGIALNFWLFATIVPLNTLMVISARYCYRLYYKKKKEAVTYVQTRASVAIVGAGQIGSYLVNELRNNPNSQYTPVCFIDTDTSKIGKSIVGLHVYSPEGFADAVKKLEVSEVIVAIARVSGEQLSKFYDFYAKLGCKVKIYD